MLHFSIQKHTAEAIVSDVQRFKDEEAGLQISGSLELLNNVCKKELDKEVFKQISFNSLDTLKEIATSMRDIETAFAFEFTSVSSDLIFAIELEMEMDFDDEDYEFCF